MELVKCPIKYKNAPISNAVESLLSVDYGTDIENADIILAGLPMETGKARRSGAHMGAAYLRKTHFWRGAICDPDLDIRIDNILHIIDCGDLNISGEEYETAEKRIGDFLRTVLETKAFPVMVGGDFSVTLPQLKTYSEKYGKMALIRFGAHPFLREAENVIDSKHSIELGVRGGVPYLSEEEEGTCLAESLRRKSYEEVSSIIRKRVGNRPVFVSFSIDFLDPAYAPGTVAPAAGGFSVQDVLVLLEKTLPGLDIKGMDFVGVVPGYDDGEVTLNSAQTVLQKMVTVISRELMLRM